MVLQYGGREWVDFAECQRLPSQLLPGDRRRLDAREQADILHHLPPSVAFPCIAFKTASAFLQHSSRVHLDASSNGSQSLSCGR